MIKVQMQAEERLPVDDEPLVEGLPVAPGFEAAWEASRPRREIGRMLESMRRDAGETQASLARKMKKDQAFVSRMESGRGPMPKAQHIALWAKHCGYLAGYAFVNESQPEKGILMPIGQDSDTRARLWELSNSMATQALLTLGGALLKK